MQCPASAAKLVENAGVVHEAVLVHSTWDVFAFPWQKCITKPCIYARAIIRTGQDTVMRSHTLANIYCARRSLPAAVTGATLKPASCHASMPPVSGKTSVIPARRNGQPSLRRTLLPGTSSK